MSYVTHTYSNSRAKSRARFRGQKCSNSNLILNSQTRRAKRAAGLYSYLRKCPRSCNSMWSSRKRGPNTPGLTAKYGELGLAERSLLRSVEPQVRMLTAGVRLMPDAWSSCCTVLGEAGFNT